VRRLTGVVENDIERDIDERRKFRSAARQRVKSGE
jgi:hypothetical protein